MIEYVLWVYRALFHCRRNMANFFFREEVDELTHHVSVSDIPWLWVGAITTDDLVCTVTNQVNDSIAYGVHVNPEYLDSITGMTDVVKWRYLDSVGLEEKDFPSEGFLIQHAATETNTVSDSGYTPDAE